MGRRKHSHSGGHWFSKTLIAIGAGICLILGIVGIVLPIIPGVLFLVFAAILLSRVSRRARNYLDQHDGWQRQRRFWDRTRFLAFHERVQLACLIAGRTAINGIQQLSEKLFTKKS